jgi:aryl-alcohol dehydrogenase-like predicted oxidoreductase
MDIICYSPLLQGLLTGKFSGADEVPVERARTRHFSGDRPQARHGEAGAEELTFSTLADLRRLAEESGLELKDLALGWLLRRDRVASILVGARSPGQAEDNAKVSELELPDELYRAASEKTEALKEAMGPNPDPWQHESRISIESLG